MSRRHQSTRRRAYGRRQHEVHERHGRRPGGLLDSLDGLDAFDDGDGSTLGGDPGVLRSQSSTAEEVADPANGASRTGQFFDLFPSPQLRWADANR